MPKQFEHMTEAERAAHYFAHRDDSEDATDWETAESPLPKRKRGRPSQGYAVSYAVRFTREEVQRLDALATAAGVTGSELIRRALAAFPGEPNHHGSDGSERRRSDPGS